jgi:NAD(P)-dependent dehydrogenase (short-subunit alcohol dehydrogenase family)
MNQSRVAIVTGGGRGIGAATSLLLAEAGYAVCVGYRNDAAAAQAVADQARQMGARALYVQADVACEADVSRLFATCTAELGAVTALVNSAGVVAAKARLEDMSLERFMRLFATNVTGTFLCCREAIKQMSTRNGGAGGGIVNLSSVAARLGSPSEYIDYAASKGAVDTLTLGLARELADEGIRVNAVRPGIIDTQIHASGGQPDRLQRFAPLIPMQRGGQPDEVASAVVWLLSDAASYTTGAFIDVAGGR